MSYRPTFRAVLTRFLPASATVFATVLGLIVLAEPRGLSLVSLAVAGLELLMLTAGYTVAQAVARPQHGGILGSSRSHAIAGTLAPFGLAALSPLAQGTNVAGIIAISLGTGVVVGMAHLAATFRGPRPPAPTLEEQEAAADAELARLESVLEQNRHVLPISRPEKAPVKHSEQVA